MPSPFSEPRTSPRKVGLLGGSFDPIHLGHLMIAQDAWEQLDLDCVYFIPAGHAPLKEEAPLCSAADRLAMVSAAIEGFPQFAVSDCELAREGRSYTFDTVSRLREQWPADRLFWIVGADQVLQLPRWHRVEELLELTEFICLQRPGYEVEIPVELPASRFHQVPGHLYDISSSEIRERLASGRNCDLFLAQGVSQYIFENKVYGNQ